MGSDRRGEKS